ncbi:hypothetical protein S40285_09897 [Stachybotrys chlorohalonatus IBT 40285]|uniref:Uncharacterized protein n=1 Tax=Stachybotrys chlorohalonatus (strain IBT 40285) TaxID=1283841 RepID=A0A084QR47_STAC4|nr:hypothetical protein S40285_09897 [Stachybotrys chlorohalonata IBT 40285]
MGGNTWSFIRERTPLYVFTGPTEQRAGHDFDYWLDQKQPYGPEHAAIRNRRLAYLRSSLFPDGNGQDSWDAVRERWFPHIKQQGTNDVSGMPLGQYLTGLYNLDGFIRSKERLDDLAVVAGLRLAVGSSIPAAVLKTPLDAKLGPDQWDNDAALHLKLSIVANLGQHQDWVCGVCILDSVKKFLQQHQPGQTPGTIRLVSHGRFLRSENSMLARWLLAIKRELGSTGHIRWPAKPGCTFSMLEDYTPGFEEPNENWHLQNGHARGNSSHNTSEPSASSKRVQPRFHFL